MSDWRKELNGLLGSRGKSSRAEQETKKFSAFLGERVVPAMNQLREELQRHGREVLVRESPASATLIARYNDMDEIFFRVLKRSLPNALVPFAEVRVRKGLRMVRAESVFRDDKGAHRGLDDVCEEDVIRCFLAHYRSAVEKDSGT